MKTIKTIQEDVDAKLRLIKKDEELQKMMIEADSKMGRAREVEKAGQLALDEAKVRQEELDKGFAKLQEKTETYKQQIEQELLKKFIR